jgi:phosphatidylinositol-3-phosphatase
LPFAALRSYDSLPAATMIIPNVNDDMHDGTIAMGDAWLEKNIAPLLTWGASHDTLFVLTWDEGFDTDNHIPTLFYGPMVKPGKYLEPIDHYTILRTIEDALGLPPTGAAARRKPVTDCWR